MTTAIHQVELVNGYDHATLLNFNIYLDRNQKAEIFMPMPGCIGSAQLGIDENFECRPFLMFETGKIDFGIQAEPDKRFGHIHWARLNQIKVGEEISVCLDSCEEAYSVVKVSRL